MIPHAAIARTINRALRKLSVENVQQQPFQRVRQVVNSAPVNWRTTLYDHLLDKHTLNGC